MGNPALSRSSISRMIVLRETSKYSANSGAVTDFFSTSRTRIPSSLSIFIDQLNREKDLLSNSEMRSTVPKSKREQIILDYFISMVQNYLFRKIVFYKILE